MLDIRRDVQRLRREHGPRLGYDYSSFTDERLTDITRFLRILYVVLAVLFAFCGCAGVMLHHVMVKQKAPVVLEEEPVELYREVTVAA